MIHCRLLILIVMFVSVCANAASEKYESQRVIDYFISGGHMARPEGNRWQVALVESGRTHLDGIFCSGTLINDKWVLTAAHCLKDPLDCNKPRTSRFWVLYGSVDLAVTANLVAPKSTVINPTYRCTPSRDDIALIELGKSITDMGYVALADASVESKLIISQQILQVSGWGKTAIGSPVSRYLMEADVKAVNKSLCQKAINSKDPLALNTICAGGGGKDSCKGDSGGPLYVRERTKVTQLGVVSFGRGCGEGPGIYTGVSAYKHWIDEVAVTSLKGSNCRGLDFLEPGC